MATRSAFLVRALRILAILLSVISLLVPAGALPPSGGGHSGDGHFGGGHSSGRHSGGSHAGGHFGWLHFGLGRTLPGMRIRSVLHFGYCAPSGAWPVELLHARAKAIHCRTPPTLLWSPALFQTRPRRSSFLRFFSRAPASSWFPQPVSVLFFLRMLLQRHESGLLLRTMVAAALVLRRL